MHSVANKNGLSVIMIRNSLLLVVLSSLFHLAAFSKNEASLFCEVHSGDLHLGIKSISLDETMEAETDEDGTLRVDEDQYSYLVDKCDRHNVFSGKVLPSIVAKIGSLLAPLGSKERKAKYRATKEKLQNVKRDPEKTMVIFFHGTGSNPITDLTGEAFPSYDEEKGGGELLSFLRARMEENGAQEGVDFISLHGPGSGNIQNTNFHTKFMEKDSYSFNHGTLSGSGAYENVQNAILHLKGVTNNPALEKPMADHLSEILRVGKVIVFGWSRGGVTAIQFARDMYHDPLLKDVKLDLFVIDAVPGLGNISFGSWKNIFHLYPNVESYFAAYSQDERSFGFTPLVPRVADNESLFSKKRKVMIISEFPGNHGTLVGNIWDQKSRTSTARTVTSFAALARVVRGLAQAFIVSHGGHLSGVEYHAKRPTSTMAEISKLMLQDFEIVNANMSDFTALQNEGYIANVKQVSSSARKYHQDWDVFGNITMFNSIVRPFLPRYTAKDISGFKTKYNHKGNERVWVNHLHKVLARKYMDEGSFDVTEFFKPTYYKTYQKLIKSSN